MMLRSPSKTVSILLAPRPFDDIRTGLDLFEKWPMMSVHFWSEPVVTEVSYPILSQITFRKNPHAVS